LDLAILQGVTSGPIRHREEPFTPLVTPCIHGNPQNAAVQVRKCAETTCRFVRQAFQADRRGSESAWKGRRTLFPHTSWARHYDGSLDKLTTTSLQSV